MRRGWWRVARGIPSTVDYGFSGALLAPAGSRTSEADRWPKTISVVSKRNGTPLITTFMFVQRPITTF